MNQNLISVEELAKSLNVPKSWVYSRTRETGPEAMPKYKVGKYNQIKNRRVTMTENKTDKKVGGRPPKYTSPAEMQKDIDAYFDKCDGTKIKKQHVTGKGVIEVETPTPYTMAGLAAALNMGRTTLNSYMKSEHYTEWKAREPEKATDFRNIITCARQKIEARNLELALVGCYDSKIAALNLSSNYGYSSKQEQDIKSDQPMIINKISYKGASGIDFAKEQEGTQDSEPGGPNPVE